MPRIAEAMDIPIDRSFVAIVPLGGRHVNHLWRLLIELDIPHATLLDLDLGRHGGGWGRIKTICNQLISLGKTPEEIFGEEYEGGEIEATLAKFDTKTLDDEGTEELDRWLTHLRAFNVFYCDPLDLDWSMLEAFEEAYTTLEADMSGPSNRGDPKDTVLGPDGDPDIYEDYQEELFKWYRYLFLGRGKPSTHVRILSSLCNEIIKENAPEELKTLLEQVRRFVEPGQQAENAE